VKGVTKFFLDTEFHEYKRRTGWFKKTETDTIDLISIGIVAENGEQFYKICNEFDLDAAWDNEWLRENVLKSVFKDLNRAMGTYHKTYHYYTTNTFCKKHLKRLLKWRGSSRATIAEDIRHFVDRNLGQTEPSFYGYFCDYDWVVFAWLFGRMIDLPKHYPMFCLDLKQMMYDRDLSQSWKRGLQIENNEKHNALADAWENHELYKAIIKHDEENKT